MLQANKTDEASLFIKEEASVTLHNAQTQNRRAKSECSFAHLLFFIF